MEAEIKKLLDQGVISPAVSAWASGAILVPKKDSENEHRLVIDYRRVNKQLEADNHGIPNINELIMNLEGSEIYSNLDIYY